MPVLWHHKYFGKEANHRTVYSSHTGQYHIVMSIDLWLCCLWLLRVDRVCERSLKRKFWNLNVLSTAKDHLRTRLLKELCESLNTAATSGVSNPLYELPLSFDYGGF